MAKEPCCQLDHGHWELTPCVHQELLQGGDVTPLMMMMRVRVHLAATAGGLGPCEHWTEAGGKEHRNDLRKLEQAGG